MITALESWKHGTIPPNPQAWLYRAAKNKAIDVIRRKKVKHKIDHELTALLSSEYSLAFTIHELFTENEIKDSQLRMMFACCHPTVSYEAQVTLMLKTLCGLSVREIADAFLTGEDTIQKRLFRTKEKFRAENISLAYPGAEAMSERIEAVLKTLYLLFNEGYNSSHSQKLIREDLCEEAMRLTFLLTENEKTDLPQTNALLALMCFHASRFETRMDENDFIVLLKDQDRKKWNQFLIQQGNMYLNRAASGNAIHDFHIEAAIASIHSNAATYEATDWKTILKLYDTLLQRTDNPVVSLNRCIVIGEAEGYDKAIDALKNLKNFENNRHYNTALGEMYFRAGKKSQALSYFDTALALTTSNAEKDLIKRKIGACI
ncbi:MAG: sigma-70 family polymerase sigma factor, partial [Bacteroidota bacterium]|nr:sigma-70 family polymerase sigma factor [Bacteroidota bacterium]